MRFYGYGCGGGLYFSRTLDIFYRFPWVHGKDPGNSSEDSLDLTKMFLKLLSRRKATRGGLLKIALVLESFRRIGDGK